VSPYFKALLQRWKNSTSDRDVAAQPPSKRQRPPSSDPAAAPSAATRIQLTEYVEENELKAVELVFRCLYMGELPAQAHDAGQLLITMYQLSDKYQLPMRCMKLIAEALSRLRPHHMGMGMLLDVYNLPGCVLESTILKPLMQLCKEALVRHFGDVPAVIMR
jgi:hypothetical protein